MNFSMFKLYTNIDFYKNSFPDYNLEHDVSIWYDSSMANSRWYSKDNKENCLYYYLLEKWIVTLIIAI